MSLGERLIIPAALTILFALMSGGVMVGVGGATHRMKIVWSCAIVFVGGMTYSMFWHDKLASLFGWEDVWMATTAAIGVGSVWLGRRLQSRPVR
jgi:hypothetical protein